MRIRSIRPEFWRSASIARLSIEDRLLFIGLWSYVDDNGVGLDRVPLIAADLFADDLSANPPEVLARVSGGLLRLFQEGRIVRFVAGGRDLIAITGWEEHQRIDKPTRSRYPELTSADAVIRETLANPPEVLARVSEKSALGEGEKGRRGEGEKDTCSPGAADASPSERESINDDFDAWWQHYPRKVGKGQAIKAYRAARKKTDHATLVAAIDAQADRLMAKGAEYCPHPATWLNGERWADETTTSPPIDDAPDESWISKPAPDWMYDAELVEKLIEEASGG